MTKFDTRFIDIMYQLHWMYEAGMEEDLDGYRPTIEKAFYAKEIATSHYICLENLRCVLHNILKRSRYEQDGTQDGDEKKESHLQGTGEDGKA